MIEYVITEHWNGLGQSWQVTKHETTENTDSRTYLRTFNDFIQAEMFINFLATGGQKYTYDEAGYLKTPQKDNRPIDSDEIPF